MIPTHFFRMTFLILLASFLGGCGGGTEGGSSGPATLVSIAVLPGVADVRKGETTQLTATGTYSNNTKQDVSARVNWSSADGGTATVSNSAGSKGLVSGVEFGTTTISVVDPSTGISSNSSNTSSTLTVIDVKPLFPKSGGNWNDYVKDGATDTACDPTVDNTCLQAGLMRYVAVDGRSSCAGLSAADSLGAFDWVCDSSTNPVRMVTNGFKSGQGLSGLIDFTNGRWLPNNITVQDNGAIIITTMSQTWWANPIVIDNDGSDGSDMNEGEVRIVTTTTAAPYTIGVDKVSLVIKPGVTLTGSITADSSSFIWIEGTIDATGYNYGVNLARTSFSTLNNMSVTNASIDGIRLFLSSNNTLSYIIATNNSGGGGVSLDSSDYNTLTYITVTGNGIGNVNGNGIQLDSSSNNMLANITTNSNDFGVYLYQLSNSNTMVNITANLNTNSGLNLSSGSYNTLTNILSDSNQGSGLMLSSRDNILCNITASNNNIGINLIGSINNYFTGQLKVGGNNSSQCSVSGAESIDPGVLNGSCANQGASDATYSEDTTTTDVLALPWGNETLTHMWSDFSTTTLLRNAVEIQGDGLGNDNTLCESGETCLYTQNIGSYQGSGGIVSAGTFTNGTLTGITLLMFENP